TMFRRNLVNFFSRHSFSAKLTLFLLVVVLMAAFYVMSLLKLYEVMAWVYSVTCGVMGGCLFFIRPFHFTEQELVNHWYRATRWVARIVCMLSGVLFIGFGTIIAWLLITPSPEDALAFNIFLLVLFGLILGGLLVVGVLGAIGWFVQGNEETRQWARTLGQRNGRTGARPTGNEPSSGS
ncbi:MAG TPA: hypothetical protein VFU69_15705, partial [Ktedonobacterales bacterium]|nr:hypothetical protein [Ktedonobacterales bacterium]